ncbi:MAG: T9SS type A sorting domain-containing protein [Bacteroidales bacterium]|nr:T9SS type A sorting domain-containing protein [Bacteroidales bacterium]
MIKPIVPASQIDLSPFAPGVYFIKAVAEGNVVAVRKVVKQ